MVQSNVQRGDIVLTAGEDLTGKENYLVVITNDSGSPVVTLPTSNDDYMFYVLTEEGEEGDNVTVRPLESGMQYRVILKDTCNPGDCLVPADVATPADAGKLRARPATPGTYRGIAVAEEAGVDTQHVLCRHFGIGNITVS